MAQFELVFKGQLVEGFTMAQASANVGKLFKASPAQVEQMFSGKAVVLRNRLDDATAKKYRAILHKNGAICMIREMGQTPPPKTATTPPATAPTPARRVHPAAAPPPAKKVETLTGLPVAGEKVDDILSNVHWDVAPVGSPMAEEHVDIPLPEPDISHLSVAEAGSDLSNKKKDEPPRPPDTSHIKLSDDR